MCISSIVPRRFILASALAFVVGCPSVIVLNPNGEGSGGASGGPVGGGPVDAGPDTQVDAGPCSVSNLGDGLVAHYPFEGDTVDATGHGLNGIPEGSYSFDDGKIGKAIFFKDFETRVTVPENPLLDTYDQFSLTAWVNPSLYPTKLGVNPVIIAKMFSPDVIGNYIVNMQLLDIGLIDGFGVEYIDTSDGGKNLVVDGVWVSDDLAAPKRIPIGAWTQVTATFDHGVLKLFLGGKLVAQKDSKVPHTETSHYQHDDVIIGNIWTDFAHNYTWQGGIDDVRIYSRPLSDDEVACLAGM